MRSYYYNKSVSIGAFPQSATWDIEFDLSEEEIQFMFFWTEASGGITTYADSVFTYTVFVDGARYITLPLGSIPTTDTFINLFNQVRILTKKSFKLRLTCSKTSGPGTWTIGLMIKTIK